jgi:hypothetical protein
VNIVEYPKAVNGKSTVPFQGRIALDPRADCLVSVRGRPLRAGARSVGHEPINGHDTVHVVQESGSTVWESWFAPGLGCALLRQDVTF